MRSRRAALLGGQLLSCAVEQRLGGQQLALLAALGVEEVELALEALAGRAQEEHAATVREHLDGARVPEPEAVRVRVGGRGTPDRGSRPAHSAARRRRRRSGWGRRRARPRARSIRAESPRRREQRGVRSSSTSSSDSPRGPEHPTRSAAWQPSPGVRRLHAAEAAAHGRPSSPRGGSCRAWTPGGGWGRACSSSEEPDPTCRTPNDQNSRSFGARHGNGPPESSLARPQPPPPRRDGCTGFHAGTGPGARAPGARTPRLLPRIAPRSLCESSQSAGPPLARRARARGRPGHGSVAGRELAVGPATARSPGENSQSAWPPLGRRARARGRPGHGSLAGRELAVSPATARSLRERSRCLGHGWLARRSLERWGGLPVHGTMLCGGLDRVGANAAGDVLRRRQLGVGGPEHRR